MSVRFSTVTQMRAYPTSGFNVNVATTCYVDALADFFKFVAGSAATSVANIVVASDDALGKWHRMGIPDTVTAGGVLLYDANGVATAYPPGTSGKSLVSAGAGLPPTWQNITPAMLAAQTAGSILLYDAAGAATAYAPVAAGRVLTDNGAGLAPTWQAPAPSFTNSGTANGRAYIPIQIDRQTPAAGTVYTSPTWAAGTYKELILSFRGKISAFAFMGFRANNDSGLNYSDIGVNANNTLAIDSSAVGTLGFSRTAVDVTGNVGMFDEVHFFPLTDGNERAGWSNGGVTGPGASATTYKRMTHIGWNDKVTDVTFVTYMLSTAATMTGVIELYGVPA